MVRNRQCTNHLVFERMIQNELTLCEADFRRHGGVILLKEIGPEIQRSSRKFSQAQPSIYFKSLLRKIKIPPAVEETVMNREYKGKSTERLGVFFPN